MKQFFFIFTFFSTLWSMNVMAFEVDGISYDVLSESDKTAFVAHQSKDIAGDVQIPCQVSYEGTVYTVTKIGARAFYECAELTSVRLPDNIIEIGDDAFIRCRKLKDINNHGVGSTDHVEIKNSTTVPLGTTLKIGN